MVISLLVFVPHGKPHRASSIVKQMLILCPDSRKTRAVRMIVMKLIDNSLGAARVAPTEVRETGPDTLALFMGQCM